MNNYSTMSSVRLTTYYIIIIIIIIIIVAANAALTLADILGGGEMGDEGSRPRVQLCSSKVTDYGTRIPMKACGRLELEDVYQEKFLLCQALDEGTNTRTF